VDLTSPKPKEPSPQERIFDHVPPQWSASPSRESSLTKSIYEWCHYADLSALRALEIPPKLNYETLINYAGNESSIPSLTKFAFASRTPLISELDNQVLGKATTIIQNLPPLLELKLSG
jgi:hypothetical protein